MQQNATAYTTERRHLLEIIDGLVEGIVLIDINRHIVWANDTALALHGVDSIAGLGGTAAGYRKRFSLRYRNGRVLRASQYPFDRALSGQAFSDLVVQVGKQRENQPLCLLQIRCLVLTDAQGDADGMVLVMQDVTARHDAEERFERTFATNPAPALICRLKGLRHIKVNKGFLQMTGYTCEQVLGRTLKQLDVLNEARGRKALLARLKNHETLPQTEVLLPTADGSLKLAVMAGQPIDVDGDPCLLFTFNDLEPRRSVENALRKSEERFSTVFRLAPVPMVLSRRDGVVIEVNEAFATVTGYQADQIVGQQGGLAPLWVDEEARQSVDDALERGQGVRNVEMLLRTHDGTLLDCLASADLVDIGEHRCVLGVIQDITERKRTEAELIAAIEAVMQDTSWFSRTVIEKLAQIRQPHRGTARGDGQLSDLTAREREVLGLICQGLSDADIAHHLGLSRNTVRNHVASLYSKIDVHRRSAAIIWARERGIVGMERPGRRNR
ncbi:PAS domain S-box protein [Bordetella petrii]|uniref:PAS domain S-box protein n=1 Tax=Bordetella petrii TaxID=94624 RepID=UPI001E3B10AD|nr:helix-turn-helix transcriptional regulator [Bordetella petrii]MCD0502408.1 helix-turn-helix transcriptional regulator [Bordetella petrii]